MPLQIVFLRACVYIQPDEQITKQDYIDLVQRLIKLFVEGTREDLLVDTYASPWHNLLVSFGYRPRIALVAEQFDEYFIRRAAGHNRRVSRLLLCCLSVRQKSSSVPCGML